MLKLNKNDTEEFLKSGSIISIGTNRFLIGYGKRSWSSKEIPDQPNFYFPDFFLNDPTPWFNHKHYGEVSTNTLMTFLANKAVREHIQWKPPNQEFFFATVK